MKISRLQHAWAGAGNTSCIQIMQAHKTQHNEGPCTIRRPRPSHAQASHVTLWRWPLFSLLRLDMQTTCYAATRMLSTHDASIFLHNFLAICVNHHHHHLWLFDTINICLVGFQIDHVIHSWLSKFKVPSS